LFSRQVGEVAMDRLDLVVLDRASPIPVGVAPSGKKHCLMYQHPNLHIGELRN